MTAGELYQALGASGYEHEASWRKGGVFHIRMRVPALSYRCPKYGNRDVIRRSLGIAYRAILGLEWIARCVSSRLLDWNAGVVSEY